MAQEARENLILDGDATAWVSSEVNGFSLYRVTLDPHADFTGEILFETRVTNPVGDPVTVNQIDVAAVAPLVPAADYIVAVPGGWDFRVSVAEAVITLAENVYVTIAPYKINGFSALDARAMIAPTSTDAAHVQAAAVAAQLVALAGVVTDLEGDTAGSSVAQAITDLGAVITALGG